MKKTPDIPPIANAITPPTDPLSVGDAPLTFKTKYIERMRIEIEGNVGIGTSKPGTKLHVEGGGAWFGGPSYPSHFPFTDNNVYVTGANIIFRGGAPEKWAERMRITATGVALNNNMLRLRAADDANHGLLYSSAIDGTEFRGYSGFRWMTGLNGATERMSITPDGNVKVTGDILLTNADCAEDFEMAGAEGIEPGTVMVITEEGALRQSDQAYDKKVAGVVSGAGGYKPGIVLDKQESQGNRAPVALMGKVYCKVDAQYSPIEVGDLLTTSPTAGHAMKAGDPLKAFGAVIGKALRPLSEGQGLIPILIALQ